MGNACCNDAKNKDEHDKNFNKGAQPSKIDPALQQVIEEAEKNPDQILKIQAGFRGMKARKEYTKMKKDKQQNSSRNNPRASGRKSNRADLKNGAAIAR